MTRLLTVLLAIFLLLIVTSVNGQSDDCGEMPDCAVVLESLDCNNLTPEEANSPCVQWQCCKRRQAAERREAEEATSSGNSETKETVEKAMNVSGSSEENSNNGESENVEDSTENADYHQGRRETKKALEEERKKEQAKARRNLEKSTGDAFGAIIGSWANGDSYLRLSYGIRELRTELGGEKIINKESAVNVETIEMGYGFGKLGIFLGGGGLFHADLASPTTEGSGFTGFGGLEFTVFKHRKGYALGINTEIGFGKLIYNDERNNGITYTNTYRSPFYSFGAQVTLFKYLFVSYNYGFHTTKNSLSTSEGNDVVEYDDVKGNFSKIGVGLMFDFDY